MKLGVPAWAVLSILVVAGTTVAPAQIAEATPTDLEAVGIDEKLENPLPLELTFNDESGEPVGHPQVSDLFGELTDGFYEPKQTRLQ